jgi:hypothetical protein
MLILPTEAETKRFVDPKSHLAKEERIPIRHDT